MKNSHYLLTLTAALLLVACSGDETINENTALDTVQSWESLDKCEKGNAGEMVFVSDSDAVYFCESGNWQSLNGEGGEEPAGKDTLVIKDTLLVLDTVVRNNVDSVFVKDTLVIKDTLLVLDTVVRNNVDSVFIKDTLVIRDTVVGLDGKSCTAEAIDDGYKILCGGDSVGVVHNGKTMCGTEAYDPAEKFCFGVELYDLCGVKAYNPNTQYCSADTVKDYLIDARDGQRYKTVTIGTQTWMAQNLNYADSIRTPSLLARSWCYENSADSCAKYGRLYTWVAAIDSVALANDADNPLTCGYDTTCTLPNTVQGICPAGWHLPNETEFQTLLDYTGAESLPEVIRSLDWTGGTDDYGFSALPAGGRGSDIGGAFTYAGSGAFWWIATEYKGRYAYALASYENFTTQSKNGLKGDGFSVRCVKDP